MNPLKELGKVGQSVWLDYIRKNLFSSGELKRLIEEDGLRGMTSNPAIFEKAIAGSQDYQESLEALVKAGQKDPLLLFEALAIRDIQDAADALLSVYTASKKVDGYVSLEVSPTLARDTQGSIEQAKRLWKAVNRHNVMIKVPGTKEGIPAIKELISEGINVNVTLLFSPDYYEAAANAFLEGLEARAQKNQSIEGIASVASFFVSRIDSLIDAQLQEKTTQSSIASMQAKLESLEGKVAISNAKLTYQIWKKLYASDRFKALAKQGAQKQRLLWASTSTKNPKYRDVIYVEQLIGKETVNTVPPATFDAFREHGKVSLTLENNLEEAKDCMEELEKVGISFKEATDQLLQEGIKLFEDAFVKLLDAIAQKRDDILKDEDAPSGVRFSGSKEESAALQKELDLWVKDNRVHRLWARDAKLWTGSDEASWMGWLDVVQGEISQGQQLVDFAEDVKKEGFKHVVLLGMGGSSLCPWMLKHTFGDIKGFPRLHVLDSTDPAQVKAIEEAIDVKHALFIVSSKSGGTLEPNIFKQYFFALTEKAVGKGKAGKHFIAITDPGTKLEMVAQGDNFRAVFHGLPSIGGRYSALSNFGMVPAALMGLPVKDFLDKAEQMVHACAASVLHDDNPGVHLGVILGILHNRGKDKVTLIASPAIRALGAWLEQLLAESTGKEGRGLIPVDIEALGEPVVYGKDRVFAYVRLGKDFDPAQDAKVAALEKAGHSVVYINMPDITYLGAECFKWEIATAVAGSVIGINAFNQPDVEAAKVEARKLTSEYEEKGSLPEEKPFWEEAGIKLYADSRNAAALQQLSGTQKNLHHFLKAHLGRLQAGDYFCISAFIEMTDTHETLLQNIRLSVRDRKKVATCLGFGPRFLHSTGQAYKGGPKTGVFLQITCDDARDLKVPEQKYTFGLVKTAQARGDLQVLADRGRRLLRIHVGKNVKEGLGILQQIIKEALIQ